MIYLVITTSIHNHFGLKDADERQSRYLYAIRETLRLLPADITPIIVENNGKRPTYLDNFIHNNKIVDVLYTDNNKHIFKSKGINEFLDIIQAINTYNIKDDDMIIKLTGRYRVLSDIFFKLIQENTNSFDAFIKFYGTCSLKFEEYDCILGYFSMRAMYLNLFRPLIINNYTSAEVAFARYVRLCGANIMEIKNLDVECHFADDLRKLVV
jgi:hypothetical protein